MEAGPARRLSVISIAVITAGLALAGCGGGHAPAPTGTGAQGTTGAGGGSAVVITATNGQPTAGAGGGSVNGASPSGTPPVSGTGGTVPGEYGFPVGPLLPTVVDSGECQAAQFKDGSVYAQIAIYDATCTQVPSVTADADKAQGKEYSAAGFVCSSVAQPAGGTYWKSPFFSYHCQDGNEQIAFNWGTSSTAF
ncbi:MAG TPA: hypothetical protein VK662_04630 [Acidothermaceae bacterium]|jgi:hypothetical protein|nr:hypothetical protein [Acidothermaceae bacterium]